jgi:hypothetical protein
MPQRFDECALRPMGGRLLIVVTACALLSACGHRGAGSASTPTKNTATSKSRPNLLGSHWPVTSIAPGTLLYDDGTRLWGYRLDGRRRLLWLHPKVREVTIAASPLGRELGYVAGSGTQQVVYDLRPDGRITTLYAGQLYQQPVFLRPPGNRAAQPRWFFTTSDSGDRRLWMQTSRDTSAEVAVQLHGGETPDVATGYPGSANSELTVVRQVQPPTFEMLYDQDMGFGGDALHWSRFLSIGQSDGDFPPAWLTPRSVLVASAGVYATYATVRLWSLCPAPTSRAVTRYRIVHDQGDGAILGAFLALDDGRVLVVTASHPKVWSVLSVASGSITPTPLPLGRGPGSWTVVRSAPRSKTC